MDLAVKVRRWREMLKSQLLFRFVVSLFVFLFLVGAVQTQVLYQFLLRTEEQDLSAIYANFDTTKVQAWFLHKEAFPTSFPEFPQGVAFLALNARGKVEQVITQQGQRKTSNYEPTLKQLFETRKLNRPFYVGSTNRSSFLLFIKPIHSNANASLLGYVVLGISLSRTQTILSQQRQVYIYTAFFVLLFGSLTVYFLLRKPLEPLAHIAKASEDISTGKYWQRIPEEPAASEIAHLRDALNHMLETLQQALDKERAAKEQMERFIADASHELRTPLTSMRGFLEILLHRPEQNLETLQGAHQSMLVETERLIELTQDLLALHQLNQESKGGEENPATEVQKLMPELLPLLRSLVEPREFEVEVDDLVLPVHSSELRQILYNLIQNAVQHTPSSGRLSLRLRGEGEQITLEIRDNGEGIPPKDLPHVFERFFRGSSSRQRKPGQGAGLGMAIVHNIVTLRGGTITVDSEPGKGTCFTVQFKTKVVSWPRFR